MFLDTVHSPQTFIINSHLWDVAYVTTDSIISHRYLLNSGITGTRAENFDDCNL